MLDAVLDPGRLTEKPLGSDHDDYRAGSDAASERDPHLWQSWKAPFSGAADRCLPARPAS